MSFRAVGVSLTLIGLLYSAVSASTAGKDLEVAWAEYKFQAYAKSEQHFDKVLESEKSSPEEKIEARYGLALIEQYRISGENLGKAVEMQRELLAEIGSEHRLAPMLHLNIGRALWSLHQGDDSPAWQELRLVTDKYPESLAARSAVIEQVCMLIESPTPKNVEKAFVLVEADLAAHPASELAVVQYLLAGDLAIMMGEYLKARDHFVRLAELGVPKKRDRSDIYTQIAQLSEKVLDDPQTAITYYNRIYDELYMTPTRDYAKRRIEELQKALEK